MSDSKPAVASALVAELRPYQWVKNGLLFVPLGLAHVMPWTSAAAGHQWGITLGSFCSFCLTASAVYVINDLHDLESDRQHPTKRSRPLAAGAISTTLALWTVCLLLAASAVLCLFLPAWFSILLAGYLTTTTAYSFWLKKKMLLDVFALAGLYTLRLIAGGAAAGVEVTNWLLAFSICLFVSLAFAKRYTELLDLEAQGKVGHDTRNYMVGDLRIIESVGPASGYLAVLVMALYINDSSGGSHQLYAAPAFLWLLCPLMMYWVTRIWFFARRRALDDDPVLFALRDRVSYLVLLSAAALVVAAWQPWRHG